VFGIQQIGSEIPREFSLYQNYPNPFNPVTKIKFDVKAKGKSENAKINLRVFDLLGKEVIKLVEGELSPGIYEVDYDASNLPSGVYFYKLVSGEFSESKRMVLVK
ncbi:MAG TPA: T9SS type A sorting domain-containing protein, partial [Ignavibacteria bacterium]|nr:T9SS type A sorting domain-containing protein [Ignavibacteria bacterium]